MVLETFCSLNPIQVGLSEITFRLGGGVIFTPPWKSTIAALYEAENLYKRSLGGGNLIFKKKIGPN